MVKKAATKEDEGTNEALVESHRLQDAAMDLGILSKNRRSSTTTLPASTSTFDELNHLSNTKHTPFSNQTTTTQSIAVLLKSDGKDIVKRSSARRSRYLIVFNCHLAPAAAGRLGHLTHLDTKNPYMYIEFPTGRLQLRGTLVFPRNKYIVLRVGNKDVVCEDVLESMIVFSESHWVGSMEENPDEKPLPMPEELKTEKLHAVSNAMTKKYSGGSGSGGGGSQQQDIIIMEDEEEEDNDDDNNDNGQQQPLSQQQQLSQQQLSQQTRRTSRHTGSKRQRYHEDSDASVSDGDDDDEDGLAGVVAEKKLPKAPRRVSCGDVSGSVKRKSPASEKKKGGKQKQKQQTINLALDDDDDSDDDDTDEDQPLAARATHTNKKKVDVIILNDDEEDEEQDDNDEDDNDDMTLSQRPQRRAAGKAKKNLKDSDESDEEDEDMDGEDESGSEEEDYDEDEEDEEDDDDDDDYSE